MKFAIVMLVPLSLVLASCGEKQWGPTEPPATKMSFACLNDPDGAGALGDVLYYRPTSTVSMTWRLPKRTNGQYIFKVYEGTTGEVLKVTTDNRWEFRVDPDKTRTFELYVEAQDKSGETDCYKQGKIVTVTIQP